MTAIVRFHSAMVAITVFLMFVLLRLALDHVPVANPSGMDIFWAAGFVALTSMGIYRFLSKGIGFAMNYLEWVRRLIFGREYTHGTWIGCSTAEDREPRYLVEYHNQQLSGLTIKGRSDNASKTRRGDWSSKTVTVDGVHGHLLFTYEFNVPSARDPITGFHQSNFDRHSPTDRPYGLGGVAHDLNSHIREDIRYKWIDSGFVPYDDALDRAIAEFSPVVASLAAKSNPSPKGDDKNPKQDR